MEIIVRERIAEVWLTNEESQSDEIKKDIINLYRNNTVVFFESGKRDLFDTTCNLILHNRKNLK